MIRVVLDTNVLVSAIRADQGPLAVIREAWLAGQFQVCVSEPLLGEVARTLQKPYFATRIGQARITRFLTLLQRTAVLQPIVEPVTGVAPHPEHDYILATAKNAHVQLLVTGDKALHALEVFESIRLIDPAAFADYLQSHGASFDHS